MLFPGELGEDKHQGAIWGGEAELASEANLRKKQRSELWHHWVATRVKRDRRVKLPGYFCLQKPHWGKFLRQFVSIFWSLVILRRVSDGQNWHTWELIRNARPPDPSNQNMHFNKITRWLLPWGIMRSASERDGNICHGWGYTQGLHFPRGTWGDHHLKKHFARVAFC